MAEAAAIQPDFEPEDDDTCQRCGGDGFVHECFDGFCEDADIGCDDCTIVCPECQRAKAALSKAGEV